MHYLRKWAVAPALVTAVIVVAGCGDTIHNTYVQAGTPQQQATEKASVAAHVSAAQKLQVALPCPPPPGEGVLGACTPKPVQVYGTKVIPVDPPANASIPDVSSYQGVVNWPAVKAWQLAHHYTPAGIFKMGEYVEDPYAARNAATLTQLGMWHAGYWFVRNTGCAHEGEQIVSTAKSLGLRVVLLDVEVSEARGYDNCLTPLLRRAGLFVGEYTSPGTYPGVASVSTNVAWMAAYGPLQAPFAPWHGRVVMFQCTDGVFGCVTSVPGIGRIDMSVNLGVTRIRDTFTVASKPKPKPKPAKPTVKKPKPTTALAVVVGRYKKRSQVKVRAGYVRKGMGRGWWEYVPNRKVTRKGAVLAGRFAKRPHRKGFRTVGLGAGWWEYLR